MKGSVEPEATGAPWGSLAHTLGVSVAATVIGLITSVVVARAAGPEGKGGYDLSLATAVLLSTLLGLGLNSGVTYVVARRNADAARLLRTLLWFTLLQGVVTAAFLLAIQWTPLASALLARGLEPQLIGPIALLVMLTSLIAYFRAVLVGWQRFIAANWRDLAWRLATLATMGGAVILATTLGRRPSALDLVWAAVAATAVAAGVFLAAIAPDLRRGEGPASRPADSAMREAITFSLPAYSGNVAQFLNYRLDLFLVGFFLGIGGVGLYALAVSLAQLLWILSNSAAAVLFPRVSALEDLQVAAHQSAQVCRVAVALSAGGAIAMAGAAVTLLPMIYGDAFRPSVEPLLLLLPGIVAFSVTNVLASYIAGVGRPGLNAVVAVIGVFVTVPLDVLLIPRLGISGAAIASTASYAVSTLATLVVFARLGGTAPGAALLPLRSDFALLVELLRRLRSGAMTA